MKQRFNDQIDRRTAASLPRLFRIHLRPLLYFCALALLVTYPLITRFTTAINDPVDPLLNLWILAWDQHALLTQPGTLFTPNIFHPYSDTLLYSENLLLPALILLPITALVGNPILTYNSMVLFGLITTGYSGYLLGRWLFRGSRQPWAAGLVMGTVLVVNPYALSVLPKAQLLQATWLPLALIYVGRTLILHHRDTEGTEKKETVFLLRVLRASVVRNVFFVALFLTAQFYSVIYYGIFGFLLVGLAGSVGWLLVRYSTWAARGRSLLRLGLGMGLGLLAVLPLALAYLRLSREEGLARTLADAWPFAASLEMWRSPMPNSWLYGWLTPEGGLPPVGVYPVESLFPGGLLLIFALLGMGLLARHRPLWAGGLVLGIAGFFVLSLGPFLQTTSLQPDFGTRLPYALLHEWLPGFTALRAPVRFALFVFLGLGIGAAALASRLPGPKWASLIIALLVIESLSLPVAGLYDPTPDPDAQAAYAFLAQQPPSAYMELPAYSPILDWESERWLESQVGSIRHWQRTPAGYSGFLPPRHGDLLTLSNDFPNPLVVDFFQALGVEWVLLHRDRLTPGRWEAVTRTSAEEGWPLTEFGRLALVRLPAGEEPSGATDHRPIERHLIIPEQVQADAIATLDLILRAQNGASAFVLPGSELGDFVAVWRQGENEIARQPINSQPPFVVAPVARAPLMVDTPADPGLYELLLFAKRGDGSVGDQPVAQASVTVTADAAPPEVTLLPLGHAEAALRCEGEILTLDVLLTTIGWWSGDVTLTATLHRADGEAVGRTGDVAFPAHRPRTNLLSQHVYPLPVTDLAPGQPLTATLRAYTWQQAAERIVSRHWLDANAAPVPELRVPVTEVQACGR